MERSAGRQNDPAAPLAPPRFNDALDKRGASALIEIAPDPVVPALRFHDLRHTAAALMIAINPNPKVIQARLGHSTISVTFDRYGHLFPGADEDLSVALDAMWRAGRGASAAR